MIYLFQYCNFILNAGCIAILLNSSFFQYFYRYIFRGDSVFGKTYFSNLSRSLTDLSHTRKKKRSKSAKARSGRTSAAS